MRRFVGLVLLLLVIAPTAAYAQASIAGTVSDGSGAVLPGVTVEASSPALIEKLRSVTTDARGQYTIVDLRPGTYTIVFQLPGFNTIRRESIQLTAFFAATVNARMEVAGVAESVTVSGETPVVDVRSTRTQRTLTDDVIEAIPSSRQYGSITSLMPAVNSEGNDVGGAGVGNFTRFSGHGGRINEGQLRIDGVHMGFIGFGTSTYMADVGNAEEVTVAVNGGLGEADSGGPQVNIVPRQGGNRFSGTVFVNGTSGAMQANNVSDEIRATGLITPPKLEKLFDASFAQGGPIRRDRLWFYFTIRRQGSRRTVGNLWHNLNAGDPTKWTYAPDLANPAFEDGSWLNSSLRLTWQATPRNKVSAWWDEQKICINCEGGGSLLGTPAAPEGMRRTDTYPQHIGTLSWTSALSNRLFLEALFAYGPDIQSGGKQRNPWDTELIQVQEQAGLIPNLIYRSAPWAHAAGKPRTPRASLSYVTGGNTAKVGFQFEHRRGLLVNFYNDSQLSYRFLNGVPNQLTMNGAHYARQIYGQQLTSAYAQDQWTRGRLTLQGGLRFEHISASFPENQIGPNRFIATPLIFPAQDGGVSTKDIQPRGGAAFDLFGNGNTALRVFAGRYVSVAPGSGVYGSSQNPAARVALTTNRAWTDGNRNYIPDCDLLNPAAQDFRSSGGDFCGAWSNQSFGKQSFETNYDPKFLDGWNVREYSWDFSGTVVQRLAPRVSAEVSYVRRVWGNFMVTDNLEVGPSDYDRFSVVAPISPLLPDGGGYTVSNFLNVSPAKFGRVNNLVTLSENYGNQYNHYNGVDVNLNARTAFGLTLVGAVTSGRILEDNCEIVAKLPEMLPTAYSEQYCNLQTPFLTSMSGIVVYTVPKIGTEISSTFKSKAFISSGNPSVATHSLVGNTVVANALIAPSLGRNLSGNAAVATLNVVKPGTMYGDRVNILDLRVSKLLTYGRNRMRIMVDVFNVLNVNTTEQYLQTVGPRYLDPASITLGRLAKFGVQYDF